MTFTGMEKPCKDNYWLKRAMELESFVGNE